MKGKTWLAAAGLFALATAAEAVQIGPDPTSASVQADGPFAVSTQTLRGNGFGGATVYSPNTAGKYAIVAFCPGFTARQDSIAVMGRRLATHGFIVATIDTNSTFDQPPSRATQLIAALNAVAAITTGPAAGKLDTSRRVVTGHSMGGGGTIIAATNNPSLLAAVALAPWSQNTKNFSGDRVPTQISVGSNDNVAPAGQHSNQFYNSMNQNRKLECIITGEDHFFVQENPADQPSSMLQISWIKRFADGDTRYSQFLNTRPSACGTFNSNGPF